MTELLLLHAAATLYMTGVIWFVQVVHYPLFSAVAPSGFATYQSAHLRSTGRVVIPGMIPEAIAVVALVVVRPAGIPAWMLVAGASLLVVVWISTFLLQVPQHRRLERGFDGEAWRRLVRTNWIRTAAWTARSAIALAMLAGGTGS